MEAVLVIDTGTSSMRGILFQKDGNQVFSFSQQYGLAFGADGQATMPASVFRDALLNISAACAVRAKQASLRISALAFTSQRSSVMAIAQDGTPLSPFLMWFDKRSAGFCRWENERHGPEIYGISGMRLTTVSSAPKMRWLKDAEPALYEKAYKLIGIHDYLLFLSTGHFVTDTSLASRTCLMDIRQLSWSPRLADMFSLDLEKLCDIVAPGTLVGLVCKEFSDLSGLAEGMPVITAGGDQQCGVLGQGVYEPGTASINNGTATYLSTPLEKPIRDDAMQINLNTACYGGGWIAEAGNTGSGIVYQWLNKEFFHSGSEPPGLNGINAAVAAVPPGSDGLICATDFAGRGCPSTDPEARGIFANISIDMTRGHFARSALEGICFDVREAYEHLVGLGVSIKNLYSSGGLTKFSQFNKMLTDILGIPVRVRRQSEATALGAFLVTALSLGWFPSPSAFFSAHGQDFIQYHPDPQLFAQYSRSFEQRRKLKALVTSELFKN